MALTLALGVLSITRKILISPARLPKDSVSPLNRLRSSHRQRNLRWLLLILRILLLISLGQSEGDVPNRLTWMAHW